MRWTKNLKPSQELQFVFQPTAILLNKQDRKLSNWFTFATTHPPPLATENKKRAP